MKLLPQLEALVLKCSSDNISAPLCYAHCPKLRMLQVGDLHLDLSPAVASFTMKGQGVVPATAMKQLMALPICLKRIAVSSVSYGFRRSDIFINNVRLGSSSLLAIATKHGPALEWTDLLLNPLLQNEQKFETFLQSCPKLSTLRLIALDRDDLDCLDEEDEEEDTMDDASADHPQLPSNGTLQLIAIHCSHLQLLTVDGTRLSDKDLIAVLTGCAMLKELRVQRASAAMTSAVLDFVGNLTVLGLHDGPQLAITEDDLVAALLANKFRNLRKLLWKDGKSAVSFIAAAVRLDTAAKHRITLLTVEAAGGW